MKDTIYALFEEAVQNHRNERAIIENNRTMTFGQLSDLVDIIVGSFPKEVHSYCNESSCGNDCSYVGYFEMRSYVCPR